jgi:glycosyltransferase involved in cell wall biosynthesis
MIESMCCHPDMKKWLGNVREVWAPTDVDVDRFKALELKNIQRMQLGFNNKAFHPDVEPIDIPDLRGRFVFGVLGSWNKRKGIRDIVRAFCRAFTSRDNVSLLLVCKYGTRPYDGIKNGEQVSKTDSEKWDIRYEFKKYIEDFTDIPHITLVDIPVHDNILPHLCANMQALVGFSMGESTWLPGLQFFGMRKPVIQLKSQCSGFTDYMTDANSYLCKEVKYIEADEELYKGTSDYYEGQQFAQGSEYELADMMKKVYEEHGTDKQQMKLDKAYETSKRWTWGVSIRNVINRLKEIR